MVEIYCFIAINFFIIIIQQFDNVNGLQLSLFIRRCCHNSRLVVDEDHLKWVTSEENYCHHQNSSMIFCVLKPLDFRKKSFYRDAIDALIHREGLEG